MPTIGRVDRHDTQFPKHSVRRELLSVSNSLSGGNRELDEIPAVGHPAHRAQIDRGDGVSSGEGQRRVAVQRRVAACRVVGKLELGKLPLQIAGIPEQYMVEKFPPYRPDQPLDKWV